MNNIHKNFPISLATKLILHWLAFFSLNSLTAQTLIALQHDGQSSFFTQLQAAHDASADGDTIYLPGGNFGQIGISKSVHLIGVGYYPDSTLATGVTILESIGLVFPGASHSTITGIYISNQIYSDIGVTGVTICRNYIKSGIILPATPNGLNETSARFLIFENFIGDAGFNSTYNGLSYYSISSGINGGSTSNLISNNIISGRITGVSQSQISNNVFLIGGFQYSGQGFTNCIVKNNVFVSCSSPINQWYSNLNCGINGLQPDGNQGLGNFLNTLPSFVNYSGSGLSFSDDFHLTTNYLGTDGTPVGIYGGFYPWKAGGVPYNPHIRFKNIAPATNAQGNLNVQIRVAAQNN